MTGIFRLSRLARRLALLKAAPTGADGHVIYVTLSVQRHSIAGSRSIQLFLTQLSHLIDWIGGPSDSSDTRFVALRIGGRP